MKKQISFISLAAIMGLCLSPLKAEPLSPQVVERAIVQDSMRPLWLTQKWDEKKDAPYVAKAREIERLIQKQNPQQTPPSILKRYEAAARANPKSSQAIFPWVYARYRLVETGRIQKSLSVTCQELYKVLVVAPSPPSAEYARLRLKIESRTQLRSRLMNVGNRLIARYKDDEQLLLAYNGILAESGDLTAAVRNEYALVKKYPNNPDYRYSLGTDLTSLAWQRRDAKLLDEGEAQFKMFEKLAPESHPLRKYLTNEREYIRLKRLRLAGKDPAKYPRN